MIQPAYAESTVRSTHVWAISNPHIVEGVRNVIRLLGATNDKIRRLKAEELVDESVVRKLEREGRF